MFRRAGPPMRPPAPGQAAPRPPRNIHAAGAWPWHGPPSHAAMQHPAAMHACFPLSSPPELVRTLGDVRAGRPAHEAACAGTGRPEATRQHPRGWRLAMAQAPRPRCHAAPRPRPGFSAAAAAVAPRSCATGRRRALRSGSCHRPGPPGAAAVAASSGTTGHDGPAGTTQPLLPQAWPPWCCCHGRRQRHHRPRLACTPRLLLPRASLPSCCRRRGPTQLHYRPPAGTTQPLLPQTRPSWCCRHGRKQRHHGQ
uniref:Uncharacterized protein n=1 Tax=Alexandrium monilatum TaxID=311494 RepID=A0A7S4VQN6_9DINO